MPRLLYTTDNLVDEVRSLLNEENADSVDTTADILPALNRAQAFAFDILARKYPEPILAPLEGAITVTGTTSEYDIPEDVFEDRLLKVEFAVPASGSGGRSFRECQRISFRDISNYESASKTNLPYYYCLYGRKIRFVPQPTGTYQPRIWVLRNAEDLVLPQGRITRISTAANYVIVDEAGDGLTTEIDQLGSYVNVIDGQTGVIRGTLQISNIAENKISFRTVPSRSTVLNRDVSGALSDLDISEDDYLCSVQGICVPYYGQPTSNFLVQFAVCQIRSQRLGGGDVASEEQVLDKFEKQVERTWVGREKKMRVQKRSQNWGVPTRRWYYE
jgi:hypothetical protein